MASIVIPKWLTKEFIEKALENDENCSIKIEDMEINMPIAKGNNYLSDIYGAKVEYRKLSDLDNLRKTSFIIKSPLIEQDEENLDFGMIEKEVIIYNEFLPKFNEIFTKNDDKLLPNSYFSTEKYVLILDDLKLKGYKLVDRQNQLDYVHSVLAIKALAKFHAASVIIHEKEPEFIEKKVGQEIFLCEEKIDNNLMKGFTISGFKLFADMLKNWPEIKKYSNWFEKNAENSWNFILDSIRRKEDEFNVLNHGDFWVSNLLYKYDENDVPIHVKLIDFQTAMYTSPVVDFINFTDGSVQENVRREYFDELINVYINELNSILVFHGCKKSLQLSEFKKQLKEREMFRLYILVTGIPYIIADPNSTEILDLKDVTLENMANIETHPSKSYYKNEKFIKLVTKIIPEFETSGLITAE